MSHVARAAPLDGGWTVLIPVKWTGRGKSRLELPVSRRRALALAMAQDTVLAAASADRVAQVVVITEDDDDAAALLVHPRVRTVRTTVDGLNESLRQALTGLPEPTGPVAVLPGDLPALDPAELTAALLAAEELFSAGYRTAVVADRDDIGSTLLTGADAESILPAYGGASYDRHLGLGAAPLPAPPESTLRHDVDLTVHLGARVVGTYTSRVLAG